MIRFNVLNGEWPIGYRGLLKHSDRPPSLENFLFYLMGTNQ